MDEGKSPGWLLSMTMGLKIRRMIKETGEDHPELKEEAQKRKEVSDSILEIIYGLITERGREKRSRSRLCEDEDGYTEL